MHVDVYEGTKSSGPYLLVQRGTGRMAAPEEVRSNFVPGQLVTRLRMISTDSIAGLNVIEAIGAIHRVKHYVVQGPIDFEHVIGQRRPM